MKLILFDLDGTLVTTGGAGVRALERAFLSLQRLPRACEGVVLSGRTDPAIIRGLFSDRLHREPTPKEFQDIVEHYLTALSVELDSAQGYKVKEGLVPLLDALVRRSDVFLALGTGNFEQGARLKLGPSGLNKYFQTGGFGSDHEVRAEVLRIGVRKSEEAAKVHFSPRDVFVVGDTVHDVAAGKAIGAVTVAMGTGHASEEELRKSLPDHYLPSFADGEAFLRLLALSEARA